MLPGRWAAHVAVTAGPSTPGGLPCPLQPTEKLVLRRRDTNTLSPWPHANLPPPSPRS